MTYLHDKSIAKHLHAAPTIILVKPQLGENIGSVARVMLNFGVTELRIVSPRDGWPNVKACSTASGAGSLLDKATVFESVADACADLNFVFSTTARNRGLTKNVKPPEVAMQEAATLLTDGLRIGILFGPENSGLENAHAALTKTIVSVPVNPEFSSLNLAQCVGLIAYEWFKIKEGKLVEFKGDSLDLATFLEVEKFRDALVEILEKKNYFWPEDKRMSLMENLNNLIGRLSVTSADVRTLHGLVKALSK